MERSDSLPLWFTDSALPDGLFWQQSTGGCVAWVELSSSYISNNNWGSTEGKARFGSLRKLCSFLSQLPSLPRQTLGT